MIIECCVILLTPPLEIRRIPKQPPICVSSVAEELSSRSRDVSHNLIVIRQLLRLDALNTTSLRRLWFATIIYGEQVATKMAEAKIPKSRPYYHSCEYPLKMPPGLGTQGPM